MGQTVLIAKDPKMSMFLFDPEGNTRGVTLANLTLEGGAVGVHLRAQDVEHGPLGYTYLTHITFRDMSVAGVFINMPGTVECSFDNNLISFCNFVKCSSGLKQSRPPEDGWGFIDKLVTYRCQFLQCGVGVDFQARRSDNTNAFIECLFQGNTSAAAQLVNNTSSSFANCDFIGNSGDPVIGSNLPTFLMSCHFEGGAGAQSDLPSRSCAEGCVFEPGTAAGSVIVKKPVKNQFYNCIATMPSGALNDGLLLNNQFSSQPEWNQVAAYLAGGKLTVLAPGTPHPGPQILVTGAGAQ